ncbi:hypothetical protein BOTBODRAFT_294280 [Botryobasidium botryosum FD-172 SS1]|uniref:Uncharacterized protein n=1 Tax=Botryobasidium botryosum (strain FD-172 SS1) TaxID=930990 RepID=A0A067MLB9_BOTB1|nr:hypothetical protein BOTBODRAFT_294280 [Botryobasidium botryosum FD-172 SS1]
MNFLYVSFTSNGVYSRSCLSRLATFDRGGGSTAPHLWPLLRPFYVLTGGGGGGSNAWKQNTSVQAQRAIVTTHYRLAFSKPIASSSLFSGHVVISIILEQPWTSKAPEDFKVKVITDTSMRSGVGAFFADRHSVEFKWKLAMMTERDTHLAHPLCSC